MKLKTLFILTFLIAAKLCLAQATFTSTTHKFSIQEPEGWQKEIARPNYFVLDNHNGENIVMFTKYPKRSTTAINPTIDISVDQTNVNERNFFKEFSQIATNNEGYYVNYKLVKEPEEIVIDGKKALYATVNFKYKGHETFKTSYRKRIYFILSGKSIYKIVFINDELINDDEKLVDELIKSIKLGN